MRLRQNGPNIRGMSQISDDPFGDPIGQRGIVDMCRVAGVEAAEYPKFGIWALAFRQIGRFNKLVDALIDQKPAHERKNDLVFGRPDTVDRKIVEIDPAAVHGVALFGACQFVFDKKLAVVLVFKKDFSGKRKRKTVKEVRDFLQNAIMDKRISEAGHDTNRGDFKASSREVAKNIGFYGKMQHQIWARFSVNPEVLEKKDQVEYRVQTVPF